MFLISTLSKGSKRIPVFMQLFQITKIYRAPESLVAKKPVTWFLKSKHLFHRDTDFLKYLNSLEACISWFQAVLLFLYHLGAPKNLVFWHQFHKYAYLFHNCSAWRYIKYFYSHFHNNCQYNFWWRKTWFIFLISLKSKCTRSLNSEKI